MLLINGRMFTQNLMKNKPLCISVTVPKVLGPKPVIQQPLYYLRTPGNEDPSQFPLHPALEVGIRARYLEAGTINPIRHHLLGEWSFPRVQAKVAINMEIIRQNRRQQS